MARGTTRQTATQTEEVAVQEDASVPEVMAPKSRYADADLRNIESFDDAMALATQMYGGVAVAHDEIGDGFRLASSEDKKRFVGVPLMFLEWTFRDGDFGDYVSILSVTQNPNGSIEKWIINDGSTGLRDDLRSFTRETGRTGGLFVRNGLRVSEYFIDPENGTPLNKEEVKAYYAVGSPVAPAATFYIDTSA